MNDLHSLLKRQLRRFTGNTKSLLEEQTDFLRAINDAYLQFDVDRRMLEQSLDLTSQELLEANAELSNRNTDLEMRVEARTAELRSSEERFRGLFEHAPLSIWEEDFSEVRQYIDELRSTGVVDFSAYFDAHPEAVAESAARVKIVDVNRATLEMYQAESKTQLQADLLKVLGPESLIPFKQELLTLIRGETSFENETVNYTLSGEKRIVFVRLTIAPGYEQTWAKVFVGISDITGRRQAEAKLEQSETLFRALFDLSPDAVLVIDPHDSTKSWPIIDCNVAACLMNGYSRDELIGNSIDILNAAPGTETERLAYIKWLRERGNLKLETNHRRKNGAIFPVEVSTTLIRVGGRELVIGIDRDITERKQSEAALAVERDLLQALMDNIPDTIYFKDTDSRFTRINRAQVNILGVEAPEDAIGKTDLDFQDPDLARGFYEEEQRLVETGESMINRIEFNPTKDGQPRWLSSTKVPLKDPDGRVIGIAGISRDITARKLVEEKLAASDAELRALFGAMQDAVIVFDRDSRYVQIAPTSTELLYQSPEEMLGKTVFDVLPQPLAQTIHDAIQEVLRTQKLIHIEYVLPLSGGEGEVWKDAAVSPLTQDTVFWIARDITDRKQAEKALSHSEERFRLMSWATKDAVWDWDLKTNQIWWGEGLQKIFHFAAETIQTDVEWWLDHIHPEDRAKVDRTIHMAIEGGMEFWSKEYRFQRLDGTYADIMDRGYILRDDGGKPYRIIGAMMDITERKYMESTLLQSNEKMAQFLNELQQRNQEVALLNEMSHLLQASQSSQEAYGIIADLASQLFPQTTGALYLLNTQQTQNSVVASWGEIPSASPVFVPSECRALRRGSTRPLNEDQYASCCLHSAQPPAVTYCLPMKMQKEIIGIFHLQSASEENLPETKRQLAYTVVEQSEMALSNLKLREALREQSIHDPLTGLYNRRYMEEALKQQLSRVTRQLQPLGIIMIDIDHFKNFNDTYGHAAGDALLRELSKFLQKHIRGEDIACRYGGEEFLLIMPDASLEAAQQRAEHLRKGAKGLRFQDEGQSHEGITLSLGVAIYPEHGDTIETVLRTADNALYRAKQKGRNRVEVG